MDIGAARTGIAVSDEMKLTARPVETVSTPELPTRLAALLQEFDTSQVVVGRPRSLDGSLNRQAEAVDAQVERLKIAAPASYSYEDETATTVEATGGTDEEAARVMLQGYLDEHR